MQDCQLQVSNTFPIAEKYQYTNVYKLSYSQMRETSFRVLYACRWHHQLDGHEFEEAPGVGDGQGSLACCSPWGLKDLDMTE